MVLPSLGTSSGEGAVRLARTAKLVVRPERVARPVVTRVAIEHSCESHSTKEPFVACALIIDRP
jgi:hypothetical protein